MTIHEKITKKKVEADAAWEKLEQLLNRADVGQAELSRLREIHEAQGSVEALVAVLIAEMTQEQLKSEIIQVTRESDRIEEELKDLQAERDRVF
jgi:hypothetical protein